MWGAIIGDLAGSTYEYSQIKKVSSIKANKLIQDNSFFSDDTILTIAILDAILNDRDYEKYLKLYGNEFINYKPNYEPYFKTTFSPGFTKWLKNNIQGNSAGNGAMMRISPIGYLFNNEDEILNNATFATIPSHNNEEAIYCAKLISLIIFYARNGMSKIDILKKLQINLQYIPFTKFNTTCLETLDNCLYATFTSNNFENSIKTVLSYGGDTDTNACIVGSMAEALYGIPEYLINNAKTKIPDKFVKKLKLGYKKII